MKNILNLFKSSNQIVAEIHAEVDSAQDRLLTEANFILSKSPRSVSNRLHNIGFVNAENVNESMIANEKASLITYYKNNYPFLKFITEDELKSICKKYNLIYMPVWNYVGNVPEKNLIEIEISQPLKDSDAPSDRIYAEIKKEGSFKFGFGGQWPTVFGSNWYHIPKVIDGMHFRSNFDADEYIRINYGVSSTYSVETVTNCIEDRSGLFIAAPKSKFKGESKAISFIEVKDPIVFRYVRGGVQVLTKWGIEGKDESLIVAKLN